MRLDAHGFISRLDLEVPAGHTARLAVAAERLSAEYRPVGCGWGNDEDYPHLAETRYLLIHPDACDDE